MAEKKERVRRVGAGPADVPAKIVLNPPTPKSEGYLGRQRQGLEFYSRMNTKGIDPTLVDDMIEFFMPYVTYPEGADEVRHALEFYATEEDIMELLDAVSGELGARGGKGPLSC